MGQINYLTLANISIFVDVLLILELNLAPLSLLVSRASYLKGEGGLP